MTPLSPPPLWDLARIENDPLDIEVLSQQESEEGIRTELTYRSHLFRGQEVRIRGHLFLPPQTARLPGLLIGHGHGGCGSIELARDFAKMCSCVSLSIDAPGDGASTGPKDTMANWANPSDDPRDSYLYHLTHAAMRGVTLLRSLPQCNPKRIAITGGSMGGLMTMLTNGADPRLACAVSTGAAGALLRGIQDGSWFAQLLLHTLGMGLDSPRLRACLDAFDPMHYLPVQRSPLLLICGAQDEFFPITALFESARRLRGPSRFLCIPDWDHGLFTSHNPALQTYDNSAAATRRTNAATIRWLSRYLHRQPPPIPRSPRLRLLRRSGGWLARALVDDTQTIAALRLYFSTDGAYTFAPREMETIASPRGRSLLVAPLPPPAGYGLAAFLLVDYEDGLSLSSCPALTPDFKVRVRPAPFSEELFAHERQT